MSAMPDPWDDDRHLLMDLEAALRTANAVPERFLDIGKGAFSWRTADAELAELAGDSAAAPAGTRARGGHRALSFDAGHLTVEVELAPDGLLGQLVPPQPGTVELAEPGGTRASAEIDDVGWFALRPPPEGLFRLRIRTAEGRIVHTEWSRA